jgi:hypothetical protein
MYAADSFVTGAEEVKEILGGDFPSPFNEVIDHIDIR